MEYRTHCGGRLIVPEKTVQHLAAHPETQELLSVAAGMIDLPCDGRRLEIEVDFMRPLGQATLVPAPQIDSDEETLFSKRLNRKGASRVVVLSPSDVPAITTFVIVAKLEEDGAYHLVTAYRGVCAPGEPWSVSPEKLAQSISYWSCHALVWDGTTMGATFPSTWTKVIEEATRKV
ncbi:MAG: hypothetical protein Q7S16_02835 [bacterium]|nr:hypothetical protein [bacterium]